MKISTFINLSKSLSDDFNQKIKKRRVIYVYTCSVRFYFPLFLRLVARA